MIKREGPTGEVAVCEGRSGNVRVDGDGDGPAAPARGTNAALPGDDARGGEPYLILFLAGLS